MVFSFDIATEAVFQELVWNVWQPIAFSSRKLSPADQKYSVFGREVLVTYTAIKNFCHLVEGRELFAFTVHEPLSYAFNAATHNYSACEVRQMAFIYKFTTDISHVK